MAAPDKVVSLKLEAIGNNDHWQRAVARETIPTDETWAFVGLPQTPVTVRVYPDSATVSVLATSDSDAAIASGDALSIAWPLGDVVIDVEDVLEPGSTGLIITSTGGDAVIHIVAESF